MITRLGLSATPRGLYATANFSNKVPASGVGALIMMLLMDQYYGGRML